MGDIHSNGGQLPSDQLPTPLGLLPLECNTRGRLTPGGYFLGDKPPSRTLSPIGQVLHNRGKGLTICASLETPYLRYNHRHLWYNLYLNECCVHTTHKIGTAVIDITSTICDIEYTIVYWSCTVYIKPFAMCKMYYTRKASSAHATLLPVVMYEHKGMHLRGVRQIETDVNHQRELPHPYMPSSTLPPPAQ